MRIPSAGPVVAGRSAPAGTWRRVRPSGAGRATPLRYSVSVGLVFTAAASYYMLVAGGHEATSGSWPRGPAFWGFAVFVAIVAGVGSLIWWKIRDDRDRLGAVAVARGFAPAPAEELWRSAVAALPVVVRRSGAVISGVFRCRVGDIHVWIFSLASADSDESEEHTVVAFDLGAPTLPQAFAMAPVPLTLGRLLARVSRRHAQGRRAFGERYRLSGAQGGPPPTFGPPLVRFFETERRDWRVETDRRWLAVFRVGHVVAAKDFNATVDDAARVFTALTGR